jgi:hypothetical protein
MKMQRIKMARKRFIWEDGMCINLKKLTYLRATCASILLAVVPFSIPASAADTEQVAEGGGSAYVMPAGDHTRSSAVAAVGAPEASPLMMPGGDAAYNKMKDDIAKMPATNAAALAASRGLAPEAGPSPQAVIAPTCATNSSTGFFPSDSHGAVGTTNMVVVTNVNVGVFNRVTCALVSNVSLKTFFNNFVIPASETLFDPRVIRDPLTGRFFLSAESRNSGNNQQFQYFAVSTNSLGTTWFRYRTTLSNGAAFFCKKAANSFWDYPSNGSSNLRWFITANDFGGGGDTSAVLTINKAPTLSGGGTTVRCYKALTPFLNLAPPIVRTTDNVATFLGTGSGSGTVLFRRDYVMNPASHAGDVMFSRPSYDIANWTGPADARQPNLQKLDSLDGRFQSASIQSLGQLWNTHAIQDTVLAVPAVRVYRLGNTSSGSSPVLNQVFAPCTQSPCDDQFSPSLGTRGEAGMPLFITFTRTNRNLAVSGRAAMVILRAINNTLAGFTSNTVVTSAFQFTQECPKGVCTSCNIASPPNKPRTSCRWGDYSATQLDPSSNSVGFGWNQIATGTQSSQWSTRGGKRN